MKAPDAQIAPSLPKRCHTLTLSLVFPDPKQDGALDMRSLIFSALLWIGTTAATAQAQDFSDSDWSHDFYKNCAAPTDTALAWAENHGDRVLRATLQPGDPGQCQSDTGPRHGARYWERAELRQRGNLAVGTDHEIRFQARFIEGFNGRQETFFQVHGWSPTCAAQPLVMLQFDGRAFKPMVLQAPEQDAPSAPGRPARGTLEHIRSDAVLPLSLEALQSHSHRFRLLIDMADSAFSVSLYVNGQPVIQNATGYLPRCATPHVKFGIYRPGGQNPHTSVVEIDDVRLRSGL